MAWRPVFNSIQDSRTWLRSCMPEYPKSWFHSFTHPGSCVAHAAELREQTSGACYKQGLLRWQIHLQVCGPRPFLLVISSIYKTRGSTQLTWKLKVYMLEMKLNSIQARDVLMCTKQRTTLTPGEKANKTRVIWEKTTCAHGKQWHDSCQISKHSSC